MLQGQDIICVSSLDWDAHWTSKQQIMHRLGRANRILYVEEPVTLLAPLKVPELRRRWGSSGVSRLRQVEETVWALRLPPLLPFGNLLPAVNRLNQRRIAREVCWAGDWLGLHEYLLWAYLPTAVDLVDRLRPRALVYHCVDEHTAFPGFVSPEVVRAYDDELTRRADLVITTAENLRLARAPLNPHTFHVPNAADTAHFEQALDPATEVPADLAAVPTPRIGVIGVHDERLDVDALVALARADPTWQVVLIGPVRPGDVDEERLRALSNIHLLGGKPLAELPAYLKGLDVALIPYKLNELSRNIFPLKLFEYLAAGVPVVSAALPELASFAGTVALAAEPSDYPQLVRDALAEDDPERRWARVELARQNTWDDRVEVISALIEDTLSRRKEPATGTPAAAADPPGEAS